MAVLRPPLYTRLESRLLSEVDASIARAISRSLGPQSYLAPNASLSCRCSDAINATALCLHSSLAHCISYSKTWHGPAVKLTPGAAAPDSNGSKLGVRFFSSCYYVACTPSCQHS
jgi:hypothetical protein